MGTEALSKNRDDNEQNKFISNSDGTVCVDTCAEISNDASNPVPVSIDPVGTPTIYNITIAAGDINVEQSQALPSGTKKILIQHSANGTTKFGFVSGLATFITLPKGTTYSETGLSLNGKTLYLSTNKIGTLEVLIWS
jgi:hypothetical protein